MLGISANLDRNVIASAYDRLGYYEKQSFKRIYEEEMGKKITQFWRVDTKKAIEKLPVEKLTFFAKHLPIHFELNRETGYRLIVNLVKRPTVELDLSGN